MGCDIHFYVEKRVGNDWESVGGEDDFYGDRNYSLFAILANVRNGYGFAGVPTGTGFRPISEPRGLPRDVSERIADAADDYGGDAHSRSWLSLVELIDYDWSQTTRQCGYLPAFSGDPFQHQTYQEWCESRGTPRSWSGMTMGPGIVTHTESEYLELQKQDALDPSAKYYVQVEWERTYSDCCKGFLSETMPRLKALDSDPQNVRVVFWFDN